MRRSREWRDDDHVAEQLRPVFQRSVRGDDRRRLLIAAHEHIDEFIAGVCEEFAQERIVDEQQIGGAKLRAELAQHAEFARFVDIFDELMRFTVDDFVAAVDGEQRQRAFAK